MAVAKQQRMAELRKIIAKEEISVANGATPYFDEDGKIEEDIATCGTCGLSWNDALGTERTPAPSARCPYEHIHQEIAELRRLERGGAVVNVKERAKRLRKHVMHNGTPTNACGESVFEWLGIERGEVKRYLALEVEENDFTVFDQHDDDTWGEVLWAYNEDTLEELASSLDESETRRGGVLVFDLDTDGQIVVHMAVAVFTDKSANKLWERGK